MNKKQTKNFKDYNKYFINTYRYNCIEKQIIMENISQEE